MTDRLGRSSVCAMTTPSPGWYDDGHGETRWWDGAAWTAQVQPNGGTPRPDAGTPPRSSRTWIAWAVGGSAAAVILIVATALTAPVIVSQMVANGVSAHPRSTSSPHGTPQSQVSDEQAARDTVKAYADVFLTGDCDLFLETTTADFRQAIGVQDCATFEEVSSLASERAEHPVVTLEDTESDGDGIIVSVVQSFTSNYDTDGELAPGPIDYEEHLEYRVIQTDDGWVIDNLRDGATPTTSDEQAALDAVERYNDAWLSADCDPFFATTTDHLRVDLDITSCAAFTDHATSFTLGTENYRTVYRNVETVDDTIVVETTETFMSTYDENGEETAEPQFYQYRYEYDVVPTDGGWSIDAAYDD